MNIKKFVQNRFGIIGQLILIIKILFQINKRKQMILIYLIDLLIDRKIIKIIL